MSGVGAITYQPRHDGDNPPVVPPLDRRPLYDQVAGEVSLTATRLAEHRCVAVDRQHVKWVAVVVLEVADWNKDGQRRRVRRSITSGDAPTVLGAPPTDLHLHEFSCGIRARFESVWWVGVNGVNGLCCAVVWRDGG